MSFVSLSQKLGQLKRRFSESSSGEAGNRIPLEYSAITLMKRSFSLGETVLKLHGIPNFVKERSLPKTFDVCVRLPDGTTRKLHGENDVTVQELIADLVQELNLRSYKVDLDEPRVPLEMTANASLLDGDTIVLEEDGTDGAPEMESRLRLVHHLWESERESYGLYKSVQDLYGDPLRKFSSLSMEDYRILFVSMEPIISISSMLCSKLEHVISIWDTSATCVGNLFSTKLWQHYQEYYKAYRLIRLLMRQKRDSDPEFVDFCNLRQGATRHSLDSLLFLPESRPRSRSPSPRPQRKMVQRIPEYDKYLSDLLSETQENHPDYDDLRKAANRVKDMVKDREGEANAVDNDYKVERVQDLFPNDDLQLREKDSKMKSKLIQRRRSAPSAVLLKSLGSARTKVAAVSGNGESNSLPRVNNNINRLYIMEGAVQLSLGLQKLDRYLFLFNDILLIAKQKSNTTFKLKHRIRVCEMWINEQCLDDVSDMSKTNDKSFVIGWPTTNMVASFSTSELKEQWLTKLKNLIGEEKTKEEPETVLLKVMMSKDTEEVVKTKSFPVEKSTEVLECVQRCMEEFEIQDGDAKDFQLWVVSGKEDCPYPLIGHEHPYSIKMSHIRDQSRVDSDGSVLPVQDMDTSPDKVSDRNYQCQFVLKHGKKPLKKFSLDETGSTKKSKKSKKSPLINLFKKSSSKIDEPLSPITGKLFGHSLSEVCSEEGLPKQILELLQCLFHHGPFTPGIFRKSANARVCKEIKEKLDCGEEESGLEEMSVLVHGATLKDFLRSLPDSLLQCDLYEQWTETNDLQDKDERIQAVKTLLQKLPAENLDLLRHFMCILYHIDQKSEENNMNAYNLAICVGPSLLWPHLTAGPATQTLASKKVPVLLQYLIENCEDVLGEDCIKLFGELVEPKSRQDSSTDSDSLHSLLSIQDVPGMVNHKESSLDSLECNELLSEMESSPKMTKSHLSPTNLSRDSGLTLSDSQLFDEDNECDNLFTDIKHVYSRSISQRHDRSAEKVEVAPQSRSYDHVPEVMQAGNPVPPPRKGKPRRGSEPQHLLNAQNPEAYKLMQSYSGANLNSRRPAHDQASSFSQSANADLMRNMRCNMPQKRVSNDSDLGSLDDDSSLKDYYTQRSQRHDMGIITKSASGCHLYIDEELFSGSANPTKVHQARIQERMRRQSSHETPPTSPLSGYSYSSQESLTSETTPPPYHRIFRRNKGPAPSPPQIESPTEGRRSSDPIMEKTDGIASRGTTAMSTSFKPKASSEPSSPERNSPVSFSKNVPEIKLPDDSNPPPLPPKGHLTLSMAAKRNSMPVKPFYDPSLGSPPPQVVLRKLTPQLKSRSLPRTLGSEKSPLTELSLSPVRPGLLKRNTFHGSLSPRLNALDNSLSSVRIPEEQVANGSVRLDVLKSEEPHFIEKSASDSRLAFAMSDKAGASAILPPRDEVQMRRPANPPSYSEALERKSLIESGASEIERIRQTVKSARARELFEKSQQQYAEQHKDAPSDQSSPTYVDLNFNVQRKGVDMNLMNNLCVVESVKHGPGLYRSKSDSCEHINKIGQSNIKRLKPVPFNTSHWRQPSPDRRTTQSDESKSTAQTRCKQLSGEHPLFYLPPHNSDGSSRESSTSRTNSRESSVSKDVVMSSSAKTGECACDVLAGVDCKRCTSASRENSFSRKRHSPEVSRENSLKLTSGMDENSPPNSKNRSVSLKDSQTDFESRSSKESTPPSMLSRRGDPPPYRPPPDINAHYATEKTSPRVSPSKQLEAKQSVKTVPDYFYSGEPLNGLCLNRDPELTKDRSLEESLKFSEESYV